jgi:hypothetical protein
MRRAVLIPFLLVSVQFLFFAPNASWAKSDWTGNANLMIGSKALNEDDWEPVDSQAEIGAEVDFAKKSWPVHLAFAALQSSDEDTFYTDFNDQMMRTKIKASTSELRFGVKKIWDQAPVIRPYVGGGLAIIDAELKTSVGSGFQGGSVKNDDQGIGLWIAGGIYWTLFNKLNLGFAVGYSKATVNLFDIDAESGGAHGAFCVGYHW